MTVGRVVPSPSQTAKPAIRVQASQYGAVNNAGRRRKRPEAVILQSGSAQGIEHTGDRSTQQLQQNVARATAAIKSLPFAQGSLIENLSLAAGNNTIQHGLPQAWRGALVTTPSAPIAWYVGQTAPPHALSQLNLNVSTPCTVDLWVW